MKIPKPDGRRSRRLAGTLIVMALCASLVTACGQVREFFLPTAPDVSGEWSRLLQEIRTFERRIGFNETDNFLDLSREHESFPFCGYASRLRLPYSYEDPEIRWLDSPTEEECQTVGHDADTYFGAVEAWGEVGTPVTSSMVDSKLDRFLYLVIHEDCHDQFELPYGIEEALCDLITFKAMAEFSAERFGSFARENRAVQRYADAQSRRARTTITYYDQLASLYGRHERTEISTEVLLRERTMLLNKAARALTLKQGELNNVILATDMTYSRHYPFLERVFVALGRDLARTVAFFRQVDKVKPTRAAVMKRSGIADEVSVEFLRAYEAAVLETITKALSETTVGVKPQTTPTKGALQRSGS